ncbi:MAG TPA: helix-turn-helix domain-containing protein [Ktedonobacterales bacterium]|jgi:excisionase family DNA binding protein|nr:helix-turn-helix domain-containing protein [Ktedonobacterales bacterium]
MAAKKATKKKTSVKTTIPLSRLKSPELAKVLLTVEEAAYKLSVGRGKVYTLMNRGELRYITVGRIRRIPVDAISEFVTKAGARYPAA